MQAGRPSPPSQRSTDLILGEGLPEGQAARALEPGLESQVSTLGQVT